ncbi:MAG: pyruvate dehydrogenase (acetyl-transferring) E1 component subunit alpha [Halobacteriales archaeon]|nr:pyruvate dehydrogenase (acetyl-transferring) E1 component subunit alpha [Halobacteriales archaeon]
MTLLDRDPDDQIGILNAEGQVIDGATVPDLDDETLVGMYRDMRLGRHFDERAVSLQRQGRMGTFPPLSGQEAAQVGSAYALGEDDWLFPSYREHAALYVRDVPLGQTLRYWMGDARGTRMPESTNVFTIAVPIATQILHATGAAWASALRGEDRAFLVNFGDGATSEGDFHEGLNFGGVFDVPLVYFCNNNQWAISVPRERQTAAATIAQKATAYGFDGVQVDGMDPLAVYQVTREAVEKAKSPEAADHRPTLIEAVQYRFGAHTTADDPSVYREEGELERWRQRDPIPRMETFLRERGLLDDERIDAIEAEIRTEVADAIEEAESTERPDPSDIFEYVFDEPTPALQAQREWLEQFRNEYGDGVILED